MDEALVLEDGVALAFMIISQVKVGGIFCVNLYGLGLRFGLHLFVLFFFLIVHRAWCTHRLGVYQLEPPRERDELPPIIFLNAPETFRPKPFMMEQNKTRATRNGLC